MSCSTTSVIAKPLLLATEGRMSTNSLVPMTHTQQSPSLKLTCIGNRSEELKKEGITIFTAKLENIETRETESKASSETSPIDG